MSIKTIEIFECTCDKCGYVWTSKTSPATCANKKCRTPRWNINFVPTFSPAAVSQSIIDRGTSHIEKVNEGFNILKQAEEKAMAPKPQYTVGYTSPQAQTPTSAWEEKYIDLDEI